MPSTESLAKVYKTTPEQRFKARDRRRALGIQPRPPADPQAARDRHNAQQRADYAAFEAAFIGPRRPRAGRCFHRRTPEAMAASAKKQHEQRKASFVGPPKPEVITTAQHRTKMADRQREKVAKFRTTLVGPPKPDRRQRPSTILRAAQRQEVAQTKAQVAAHKAAAKAQAAANLAAARATETAGKSWDRETVKMIRKTARYIREQVREAAQIAAKAVTPERRAASKAAYEAAMAAWDADVRRIADETRNAYRRRVDAEDERAKRSAAAALEAQSLLSSTVMRGPVRRTPLLRS